MDKKKKGKGYKMKVEKITFDWTARKARKFMVYTDLASVQHKEEFTFEGQTFSMDKATAIIFTLRMLGVQYGDRNFGNN